MSERIETTAMGSAATETAGTGSVAADGPAITAKTRVPSPSRSTGFMALLLLSSILLLSFLPLLSRAADAPGITAAPVLQIPVGARAVGMGSAFTGVADDISTLHYNPAGLSTLDHREASFMYMKGLADQNVEYMAAGSPIPFFSGLLGNGAASLGGSLLFSQNGSIQFNQTNADGSLLSSQSVDAGGDLVLGLTYSERVLENTVETPQKLLRFEHFFGLTGKWIRSTLGPQYSASAGAMDAGYFVRMPDLGWSAGASVLNAGGKMTFISEGDPLPLTLRGGGAYRMKDRLENTIHFAGDGDYLYYEKAWHVNMGVEYEAMRRFAARVGYQFRQDVAGLTVGLGARWDNFALDYAWALSDAISDVHRISFTYRFGKAAPPAREKPLRRLIDQPSEKREMRNLDQMKIRTLDTPPQRRDVPESQQGAPGWIY